MHLGAIILLLGCRGRLLLGSVGIILYFIVRAFDNMPSLAMRSVSESKMLGNCTRAVSRYRVALILHVSLGASSVGLDWGSVIGRLCHLSWCCNILTTEVRC